jgi:hypothetical protein
LLLLACVAQAQDPQPQTQTFPGMLNPSISANGLFLGGVRSRDGTIVAPGTGLSVQELEVQLTAAVDPYFSANMVLALPEGEGIEAEEAYVALTSVPRLLVNVGKIKEPFGRENLVHTHALLTVDKSLIGDALFGEEGLNDMGVNAALLLPTPWFSEVTLGVDAGDNEGVYASGLPEGLGSMAHWKNLFDAGSTSVELGVSGLTGLSPGGRTIAEGADLTVKTRGTGKHEFQRLVWQSELMLAQLDGGDRDLGGFYSTLEGAFNKRFWLGGRYDHVGLDAATPASDAATAIATLVPTEFSALRIQGQRQFLPGDHTVDSVVAQLIFAIGAHPAHSY